MAHEASDSLDLSILVVSYNTRDLTLACIASVFENTPRISFEVIVVDNASSDESAAAIREAMPDVMVIDSGANRGFAAACNMAAKRARGEYLLLLNPDTFVRDDSIARSLEEMRRRPEVGVLGVRTLYEDGSLNYTSCFGATDLWGLFTDAVGLSVAFAGSPWLNPMGIGGWQRDTNREVATITGCFLMVRRDLWEALGGLDERFFMYSEDVDFSARVRARGLKCMLFADASVMHHGGRSESVRAEKIAKVYGARVQYIRKHWNPVSQRVGLFLLDLGVGLRAMVLSLIVVLRPALVEKRSNWRAVWRARHHWHAFEAGAEVAEITEAGGLGHG